MKKLDQFLLEKYFFLLKRYSFFISLQKFVRSIFINLISIGVISSSVNVLVWIEQLVGIFFFINLIYWSFVILLPYPVERLTGKTFCKCFLIVGNMRVNGTVVWSCLLAIYRILYIRYYFLKRILARTF